MFRSQVSSRSRRYFVFTALLAATCSARADDDEKLPDGVAPITKEHLVAKVPNFFYFDYPFDPKPGKRIWLRVDNKHFLERYPDGTDSIFKILGHTKAKDMSGTIAAKIEGNAEVTGTENDGSFQVFIPDKGNESMVFLIRNTNGGNTEWSNIAIEGKPTVIQKVE